MKRPILILCLLALASCSLLRPRTPEEQAQRRGVLAEILDAVTPVLVDALVDAAGRAIDVILHRPAVAQKMRTTRAAASGASGTPAAGLERVRPWSSPIPPRDRVRLYAGPDGQLLAAVPERGAARLEDAAGAVLERVAVAVDSKPDFFQAKAAGDHVLTRSAGALYVGPEKVAVGTWESYVGIDGLVLGWWPCTPKGCPAAVLRRVGSGWASTPGPVEVFGADLALSGGASSTVAIATRQGSAKTGWTLVHVEVGPLYSEGRLVPTRPAEVWAPGPKLSLEDPALVQGAPTTTIVGALYDLKADRPTGRIYLAQSGDARLKKVLEVAPTPESQEVSATWYDSSIWLTVDVGDGTSGLWRYVDRRGLVLVATAPGTRPSVATAEGRLWVSTAQGLFAMPP